MTQDKFKEGWEEDYSILNNGAIIKNSELDAGVLNGRKSTTKCLEEIISQARRQVLEEIREWAEKNKTQEESLMKCINLKIDYENIKKLVSVSCDIRQNVVLSDLLQKLSQMEK